MQNKAPNAMDLGPEFIIAFQGEPDSRGGKSIRRSLPLAEGEETMVLRPSIPINTKSLPDFDALALSADPSNSHNQLELVAIATLVPTL
jgi:hypothetical protein